MFKKHLFFVLLLALITWGGLVVIYRKPSPTQPQSTPDVSASTPASTSADSRNEIITIALNQEEYHVGDTVEIRVTLTNKTTGVMRSTLKVKVVADNIYSKMAYDYHLQTFQEEIAVEPNSSETVKYDYDLASTLSSNHPYYVITDYAEDYLVTSFALVPLFETQLTLPEHVQEKELFTVKLEITNPTDLTLKDINITLGLGYLPNVETTDPLERHLSQLEPGTSQLLTWNLKALSPSEVEGLVFNISSANGGNISLQDGFSIY